MVSGVIKQINDKVFVNILTKRKKRVILSTRIDVKRAIKYGT